MDVLDWVYIVLDTINAEDLLFWLVWLAQLLEWFAMSFLIFAQKDKQPDEILFDHENPPVFASECSSGVFFNKGGRGSSKYGPSLQQINYRARERRLTRNM